VQELEAAHAGFFQQLAKRGVVCRSVGRKSLYSFVYSVVCLFLQGRLTRGHTDFLFLVFFKKITRKENSIYLVEL
jgi:hypothetical protein